MEKKISIIQGLTDTDQANPIRITDAGEVKTSGSINPDQIAYDGSPSTDPNGDLSRYINAPVFKDFSTGYMHAGFTRSGDSSGNITTGESKILVEQGKQFQTFETYVSDASGMNEVNISVFVNGSITAWSDAHGPRYDDMSICNVSNGLKFFLVMTIVRYY